MVRRESATKRVNYDPTLTENFSEGTLVPGAQRYFLAILASNGNTQLCSFHHWRDYDNNWLIKVVGYFLIVPLNKGHCLV